MKIVHVLLNTAHGPLSYIDLRSGIRGVTGSEQAMLYLAREQSRLGHDVVVYLPTKNPGKTEEGVRLFEVARAWPRFREADDCDVMISWLSCDPLRHAPQHALRICNIQINDWLPTADGFEAFTDLFVSASEAHWDSLMRNPHGPKTDVPHVAMPNGTAMGSLPEVGRIKHRFVYLSSPDRGLHWALYLWPEIRQALPGAELHIFYEITKWLDAGYLGNEVGNRARYIVDRFNALRGHGVVPRGALPPVELEREMMQAELQLYPCDPVIFTEGFGVAVLDSCATGVVPVITDADALGEVYAKSGAILVQRTGGAAWTEQYLEHVIRVATDPRELTDRRKLVQEFSDQYKWPALAQRWENVVRNHAKIGSRFPSFSTDGSSGSTTPGSMPVSSPSRMKRTSVRRGGRSHPPTSSLTSE